MGHGHFASGLLSSLELIAGTQERITALDFIESMSSEELEEQLRQSLKDKTEVLILCDLLGGTPFKVASLQAYQKEEQEIQVIAGTNLPLLLNVALSYHQRDDDLIEKLTADACKGIVSAKNLLSKSSANDWEDGI